MSFYNIYYHGESDKINKKHNSIGKISKNHEKSTNCC